MKTGFACPNGETQNVEDFHHRSVVPRETEDAVVIGAGVVGIAVARELATKMTLVRLLCRSILRRSQYLFCAGATVNRHICHLHLSSSSLPAPSSSRNPNRDAILLKEKFVRCPLKMDSPELVLSQSHGQARLVADFLHENVLDFVSEEAIEDAWAIGSYLSDTDLLLSPSSGTFSRSFEAENLKQSIAASIAVCGVLFGNCYSVSSRLFVWLILYLLGTHTRMHGTRIANDGGSRSYEDGTGISVRESSAVAGLWDCR